MSHFKTIRNAFSALAGIACFIAAPAMANSAASADIAAPLRAAEAAKNGTADAGDSEFRQLFANWQALDKIGRAHV